MYTGDIKILFQDYSKNGDWEDWSEWLITPPDISEKIESESKGLPGVLSFDSASITLRYETGTRPFEIFSGDLTTDVRYVFEIIIPDNNGTLISRFKGIADISTVEVPFYDKTISLELIDRLTAINKLVTQNIRETGNVFGRVYNGDADRIGYSKFWNSNDIQFRYLRSDTLVTDTTENNTPQLGDILQVNYLHKSNVDLPDHLALITFKYFDSQYPNGRVFYGLESENTDFYEATTDADQTGTCDELWRTSTVWYSKLFYNQDIYLKRYRTDYPVTVYEHPGPTTQLVSGYEIYAFDGVKLVEAIVKQQWSEITIENRTGADNFPIPISFFNQLIGENPFGEHPFDALVYLADTMKCYIFLTNDDKLVIQSKENISLLAGTERTLGITRILDQRPKFFWDKLVDGVEVTIKSWLKDAEDNEIEGYASLFKGQIKPKNSMDKTLLCPDPEVTSLDELNAVALSEAQKYFDFYGKRHKSSTLTLDLDSNTSLWKLTDWVNIEGEKYFIISIEIEAESRTIDVEIVSVTGYPYDLRSIHIGKSSNLYGGTSSGSSTVIQSSGSLDGHIHSNLPILNNITAPFTQELKDAYDSAVSVKHTHANKGLLDNYTNSNDNITSAIQLKHEHSNKSLLDVINQELEKNSTPEFSQIKVGSPIIGSHVVPASRTLQILVDNNLTIDNSSTQSLLSNRSWSIGVKAGSLNGTANQIVVSGTGKALLSDITISTPQDIATTSIPQFAGLKIGVTNPVYDITLKDNFALGNTGFSGNNTSIFTGSGLKMWGENNKYNLVLDNLTVRNQMNIFELVLNQIRATNGSLLVSSTCKVNYALWNSGAGDQQEYVFETTDQAYHGFVNGDLIRCRKTNFEGSVSEGDIDSYSNVVVHDIKMQVTWVTSLTRFFAKTVSKPDMSGWAWDDVSLTTEEKINNAKLLLSKEFVRIGHISDSSRQGLVYLTSDDNDSPFIDILDGVSSHSEFGQFQNVKARLGRLSGLSDPDLGQLSGYGLYSTNVYLKGKIVASSGKIAGHNISSTGISKTDGYKVMEMNSDQLYFLTGTGQDVLSDGKFILSGKIPVGDCAGEMGIISHDGYNNKTYFLLAETQRKISSWSFDESKLFNGGTRIESSDELKGVAVTEGNKDVLKFGDFVRENMSYETIPFTLTSGWIVESLSHQQIYSVTDLAFSPTSDNDYRQFLLKAYKTLPDFIKGKTVEIEFNIAEIENQFGDQITNISAMFETDKGVISLTNITPKAVQLPADYETVLLRANIPNSASYIRFKVIVAYNTYSAPATIVFSGFDGRYYNRTITEINKSGIRLYNSPINRIELSNEKADLQVPEVNVNSLSVGEWVFKTSAYLEGDGVTIKERLELRHKTTLIDSWDA